MKRLQIALMSMALAACASAPPAQVAREPEVKRHCLKETGTRLEKSEGECVNAPGRVYTREDLDRTGEISTEDALRRVLVR